MYTTDGVLSSASSSMAYKLIVLACFYLTIGSDAHSLFVQYDEKTPPLTNKKPFTIDDVASYSVKGFNGTWISNKEIFYRRDEHFDVLDVSTQKSRRIAYDPVFLDQEVFPSADGNYVLLKNFIKKVNSYAPVSKYSVCEMNQYGCSQKRELVRDRFLQAVLWSPKESALAYVLDNDIYYQKFANGPDEVRRITTTGVIEQVFNGIADWVYGEEIFQFELEHRLMWFSPNGEYLAFVTLDDSNVNDVEISRYNTPGSFDGQYVAKYKYPKPGQPISNVSLSIIDLTKNDSSPIKLYPPADVGSEPILFAVNWLHDKTIVATWTNRAQNYSQIVTYSLDGQSTVLLTQESPDGWLLDDITSQPPRMSNDYFVLIELQSIDKPNVGSFPHVIRYRLENGKLSGRVDLTPEATWVTKILGIDESRHLVYYIASPPDEPSQKHLYSVDVKVAKPKCLSCEIETREGNACKFVSEVSFSKDFSYCALSCTGPDPASIIIYSTERHVQVYEWLGNEKLRQIVDERILPKPMKLEVPANGFNAKVHLLLPVNFDATKKYPLVVKVYGGPNSQLVTDEFAIAFEQYMTTRRQVIHAVIDGRGTNSKGTAMMYAVHRKLGSAEMEDQITVTKKLQEMYSWIDSNRTGIWGRSYGGYSTAMILAKDDSDVFKCGIAVAPVVSWFLYDAIYTERYMGLPTEDDNLEGYKSSQVMEDVRKFLKKRFLLVHGTGDDNVHFQNSMALSKALVDAGVLFEQFFYPDEYHPLKHVYAHLYRTFDKFFSECFAYDFD